jgi:hypothetical protein
MLVYITEFGKMSIREIRIRDIGIRDIREIFKKPENLLLADLQNLGNWDLE